MAELTRFKPTRYLHTGLVVMFLLFTVQMVFFYNGFTFREKQHEPQDTYIERNAVLKGMRTTASNAALLQDLTDLWEEHKLSDHAVLTFGEVPGIAYYMGSRPALSSTWPILDSYSVSKFENGVKTLEGSINEKGENVVIVTDGTLDAEGSKQEIIKKFINDFEYDTIYDKSGIKIWLRQGE